MPLYGARAAEYARERYHANPGPNIAKAKAWKVANRERARATDRERRARNADAVNAYEREWRAANTETSRRAEKTWRKANPDSVRAMKQRRRAREQNAPGTLTAREWTDRKAEFLNSCAYCNATGTPLEMEHMTPLSRGGRHDYSNVVPACPRCNRRKGVMTALEFLKHIDARVTTKKESRP